MALTDSTAPVTWIETAWHALASKASFSMRPRPWSPWSADPRTDPAPAAPSSSPSSVVFGMGSDYGNGLLLHLLRSGHVPTALVTSTRFGHAPEGGFYQLAAKRLGIPLLAGDNVHTPDILAVIRALGPDLAWVFSFDQIFKPPMLEVPRLGMVNFHPSRLPKWRGPEPIWWQVAEGETITGMTASLIDEGIDAGPIIEQTSERVLATDTSGSLARRIVLGSGGLIHTVLRQAGEGRLQGSPIDLARGSYRSGVIGPRLDFTRPAEELERAVRAGLPDHPATVEDRDGRRLRVRSAKVVTGPDGLAPGEILDCSDTSATVVTGDGALALVWSPPAGERARFQ